MTRLIPAPVVAGLILIVACGADNAEPGTETPTTTPPGTEPASTDEGQDMDLIDAAIADLATRIGAQETEIEVVAEEEVTWPDGSIGCPEPGESYTQALVEGGRIVLGHDEMVYVYHYGEDRAPFLCPNPESTDGGYQFIPPPGGDVEK